MPAEERKRIAAGLPLIEPTMTEIDLVWNRLSEKERQEIWRIISGG